MPGEKLLHSPVEIETILFIVKTVTLVFLDHIFYFNTPFAQGIHDLVGFGLLYPGIVRSLGY